MPDALAASLHGAIIFIDRTPPADVTLSTTCWPAWPGRQLIVCTLAHAYNMHTLFPAGAKFRISSAPTSYETSYFVSTSSYSFEAASINMQSATSLVKEQLITHACYWIEELATAHCRRLPSCLAAVATKSWRETVNYNDNHEKKGRQSWQVSLCVPWRSVLLYN